MKPKATLILGGGSALGLAHIGALEALERHFEISGIIGTSMGAIIGALYSCGLSPQDILRIATRISIARVFVPFEPDSKIQGISRKMLFRLSGNGRTTTKSATA
jgi:NTE family protein